MCLPSVFDLEYSRVTDTSTCYFLTDILWLTFYFCVCMHLQHVCVLVASGCVCGARVCMCMCVVTVEVRRGHWMSGSWSDG